MKYPRVWQMLVGHPWAIADDKYLQIRSILVARMAGIKAFDDEIEAAQSSKRKDSYQTVGKVAVIPIMGVIHHRADAFDEASGGVGCEDIGRQFDAAIADKTVNKIVLQIDSPGGSVYGTEELANKIRAGRDVKKVIAVADPVCASGAYWLGSQASEFLMAPSGQVGSIGVVAEHNDYSEADKMEGRKVTLIRSTPLKQEAHSSFPLSAEAAADQQSQVDTYYTTFLNAVAKGRQVSVSKVEKDFGGGRMMGSAAAKAAGMVDGIATMETVMRRLGAELSKSAMNSRARLVEIS